MNINEFKTTINLPNAPTGDELNNLPPYCEIKAYDVDEYECPKNWMNGSYNSKSYFIELKENKHLWIDLNDNLSNTHDIAVVLSVQGINPITGEKTTNLKLEKYDKCPKHDINFQGSDRYCTECEYNWPAQNYMSTTCYPYGQFWVDGWRNGKDEIRGFLITSDVMKGIASQLIGDDRVYAIGLAFYKSKIAKPIQTKQNDMQNDIGWSKKFHKLIPKYGQYGQSISSWSSISTSSGTTSSGTTSSSTTSSSSILRGRNIISTSNLSLNSETCDNAITKTFEIAAGARIKQNLSYADKLPLSYYNDEPDGFIYINYCDSTVFNNILSKKKQTKTFLSHLKVGN